MKRMPTQTLFMTLLLALCMVATPLNARLRKRQPKQESQYSTTVCQEPTLVVNDDNTAVITKESFDTAIASPTRETDTQKTPHLLATIQRDLQSSEYRQDILPNNFGYLSQLLQHGTNTKQTPEYAQNVLSLFSKLLKGSEYVNSYVFSNLVAGMPDMLKFYLNSYQLESAGTLLLSGDLDMLERMERTISHLVFNKFTQDFDTCKQSPKLFLDDLSHRVFAATTQEVTMELLRQTLVRFLEVGLSKLVWSPHEAEKSWESVKTLSQQLATLMEYNIIGDLNDLDDLYWSLLHRYRYFIELHGSDIDLAFYQKIKADITAKNVMLLELEEQETFIESKASCLLSTVLAQEAKKRMYDMPGRPQTA
jgi:hypothetical protein